MKESRPTRACELKLHRSVFDTKCPWSRPTRACELKLNQNNNNEPNAWVTPYTGV